MKPPSIPTSALFLAGILSSSAPLPAEVEAGDPPRLVLEPLSMTLSKFDRNVFGRAENPFSNFSMNAVTGTILLVKVTPDPSLKGRIVPSMAKLHSFRDDQGSDLLKAPERQGGRPAMFDSDTRPVSVVQPRGGKFFGLQLSAPQTPSAGATRMIAKGSLFFAPEEASREAGHGKLVLKPDEVVQVGPVQLKFARSRAKGAPEGLWLVQIIESPEAVNATLQIFGDNPDEPIRDTATNNGSTFSFNGVVSYGFTCPEGEISQIKVHFCPVEKLTELPFTLETGLGNFAGGGRIVDPFADRFPKPKAKPAPKRAKDQLRKSVRTMPPAPPIG